MKYCSTVSAFIAIQKTPGSQLPDILQQFVQDGVFDISSCVHPP
jgi:hypothetical protein